MPKYLININGEEQTVDLVEISDRTYRVTIDGVAYSGHVEEISRMLPDEAPAEKVVIAPLPVPVPLPAAPVPAPAAAAAAGNLEMRAPLAGTIIAVRTQPGAAVRTGDLLLLLEAMKMETEIVAVSDGTVGAVVVHPGQTVQAGELLLTLVKH